MMDLNKLEELARAATPGPWWADKHEDWAHPQTEVLDQPTGKPVTFYNSRPEYDQFMFCGTRGKAELEWANATFIAAANPAAVQELIDLIRKQEARIDELTIVTGDQHMRLDAALFVQAGLVNALNYALHHLRGEERDVDGVEHKARIALAAVGVTL